MAESDHKPREHGYRRRKVDMEALARDVEEYPDTYQSERATLGVHPSTVSYACKKWKITRKKTWGYKECDNMKRHVSLRLRERYGRRGKSFVYADESRFEHSASRVGMDGLPKGQKLYRLRSASHIRHNAFS